jgi:hypothetical protein
LPRYGRSIRENLLLPFFIRRCVKQSKQYEGRCFCRRSHDSGE